LELLEKANSGSVQNTKEILKTTSTTTIEIKDLKRGIVHEGQKLKIK
jgi:hypothetical protein